MSASTLFAALTPGEKRTLLAFFRLEGEAERCSALLANHEEHLSVAGDQLLGIGVTLHAGRVCDQVLFGDTDDTYVDRTKPPPQRYASATDMKVFVENATLAHFVRNVLFAGTSNACKERNAHSVGQVFEALLAISSLYTVRADSASAGGNGGDQRLPIAEQIVADYLERLLRHMVGKLQETVTIAQIRDRSRSDIVAVFRGSLQNDSRADEQQQWLWQQPAVTTVPVLLLLPPTPVAAAIPPPPPPPPQLPAELPVPSPSTAAAERQVALPNPGIRPEPPHVMTPDEYFAWCKNALERQGAAAAAASAVDRRGGQHPAVRIQHKSRQGNLNTVIVRMCCGKVRPAEPRAFTWGEQPSPLVAPWCPCDPDIPPTITHKGRLLQERHSRSAASNARVAASWSCCGRAAADVGSADNGWPAGVVTARNITECTPCARASMLTFSSFLQPTMTLLERIRSDRRRDRDDAEAPQLPPPPPPAATSVAPSPSRPTRFSELMRQRSAAAAASAAATGATQQASTASGPFFGFSRWGGSTAAAAQQQQDQQSECSFFD